MTQSKNDDWNGQHVSIQLSMFPFDLVDQMIRKSKIVLSETEVKSTQINLKSIRRGDEI